MNLLLVASRLQAVHLPMVVSPLMGNLPATYTAMMNHHLVGSKRRRLGSDTVHKLVDLSQLPRSRHQHEEHGLHILSSLQIHSPSAHDIGPLIPWLG